MRSGKRTTVKPGKVPTLFHERYEYQSISIDKINLNSEMIDKTCNDNSSFAENPSPPVVCYDDEIQNDSYDRMSLIEPFAHHPEPEDLLSTHHVDVVHIVSILSYITSY